MSHAQSLGTLAPTAAERPSSPANQSALLLATNLVNTATTVLEPGVPVGRGAGHSIDHHHSDRHDIGETQ